MPGQRHRPSWIAYAGALVAAGGAIALIVAGVRGALVAVGLCVAVALGAISHRARRSLRSRSDNRAARDHRRDAAVRILWAASGDFLASGWGRSELESLRLLALNLPAGHAPGPRLADRLRNAASTVLSGVLDRLNDVVLTAREIDLEPAAVNRLEAAIRVLAAELEDSTFRAGQAIRFRPDSVATAASQAVAACGALRDALRPWIVSDVPAIVDWLVQTRHGVRISSGELIVDLDLRPGESRVAVRPLDLAQALDELLDGVFGRGRATGPVRLAGRLVDQGVVLTIGWAVDDRFRLDPRAVTEPLRVLSSYGARLALEEDAERGSVRLVAELPSASELADAG